MNNHNIPAMFVSLLTILVLMSQIQTSIFFPRTFGLLPIPSLSNHTPSISIHTSKTIQANNFNIIKQEEAAVKKAILSDIAMLAMHPTIRMYPSETQMYEN